MPGLCSKVLQKLEYETSCGSASSIESSQRLGLRALWHKSLVVGREGFRLLGF